MQIPNVRPMLKELIDRLFEQPTAVNVLSTVYSREFCHAYFTHPARASWWRVFDPYPDGG
jgi:hypothetical protein